MMRGADAEIDRVEEQLARFLVAVEGKVGEAHSRVVEIPAVDCIAVLVGADIGQITAQSLDLGIVKPAQPRPDLALERMALAAPPAALADRREQRELDHRIRVFGVGIGVEIALTAATGARLRGALEIAQGSAAARHPVAVVPFRLAHAAIDRAEHVEELPGAVVLLVLGKTADDEVRVAQRDLLARGQRFGGVAGLGRGQVADLGPLSADAIFRLGPGRLEVIGELGQVLNVEDLAELGLRDLEIAQSGVEPALSGLDLALGAVGPPAAAKCHQIAWNVRHVERARRTEADAEKELLGLTGFMTEHDAMGAERAPRHERQQRRTAQYFDLDVVAEQRHPPGEAAFALAPSDPNPQVAALVKSLEGQFAMRRALERPRAIGEGVLGFVQVDGQSFGHGPFQRQTRRRPSVPRPNLS